MLPLMFGTLPFAIAFWIYIEIDTNNNSYYDAILYECI